MNDSPNRQDDLAITVALIRGMVLAEAASQAAKEASEEASGEGVRTEVVDDSNIESFEVRVFIGKQSVLISFAGIEVTKVLGDAAVRTAVDERIRSAIASLQRPPV